MANSGTRGLEVLEAATLKVGSLPGARKQKGQAALAQHIMYLMN